MEIVFVAEQKFELKKIERGFLEVEVSTFISETLFDDLQLIEIDRACKKGLNITYLNNNKISAKKMSFISILLYQNINPTLYIDCVLSKKFDDRQLDKIFTGLLHEVEVEKFAKPDFDYLQMESILEGMIKGINIDKFLDSDICWLDMKNEIDYLYHTKFI